MENQNPYAAPQEMGIENAPDDWVPPPPNPIASADERVTAFILDGILLGATFISTFIFAASATDANGGYLAALFVAVCVGFCNYFLLELNYGKSIGKVIARTRVLTTQGGKPNSRQILKRALARLIPIEVLSFLGEQGHPIGWHDLLSDTVVVADKRWRGTCTWLPFDGNDEFRDGSHASSDRSLPTL